ncbi:MAG: 4Fe-4S dicluster domain-containing protein [Deltaproteobacteria bacterium]|nr:4Fe-4S dicluster domain-containing protein [Deltaproteobacteria bacterium]
MSKINKHPFTFKKLHKPVQADKRRLLLQGVIFAISGFTFAMWRMFAAKLKPRVKLAKGELPIRPPGAVQDEASFQAACIHCGMCGMVCESGCIRFFGANDTEYGPITPYLDVRRRSCVLCMRCTDVCPTGALTPIVKKLEVIRAEVHMGKAEVDAELCISYLGRVCGYCHDACPIPQSALRLLPPASPKVLDGCIGCGRCVEFCPQTPTAIQVFKRFGAKGAKTDGKVSLALPTWDAQPHSCSSTSAANESIDLVALAGRRNS